MWRPGLWAVCQVELAAGRVMSHSVAFPAAQNSGIADVCLQILCSMLHAGFRVWVLAVPAALHRSYSPTLNSHTRVCHSPQASNILLVGCTGLGIEIGEHRLLVLVLALKRSFLSHPSEHLSA